jgi:ribulose-bisphosphate carboxylase large chain
MVARGKYVLSQFCPLGENAHSWLMATSLEVRLSQLRAPTPRNSSALPAVLDTVLITSPQTQCGCITFVHTKISRVIGASGIHVGTMSFGKMEGDASDRNIAFRLQEVEAGGPYYHH